MAIEDVVAYVGVLVLYVGFWLFIRRGRQRGYEALAQRAQELTPEVNKVYLMVPIQYAAAYERGLPIGLGGGFDLLWYFLITGCLAYLRGDELVIEAPWWQRMRPVEIWDPPSLTLHLKTETSDNYRARRPLPGVIIGNRRYNRSYVVVGSNVIDPLLVKQAMRVKDGDPVMFERNRDELLAALERAGFQSLAA